MVWGQVYWVLNGNHPFICNPLDAPIPNFPPEVFINVDKRGLAEEWKNYSSEM